MIRLISATLTLCIMVISITVAFGNDEQRLKKDFKAIYSRQAKLSRKRDVQALMELNTPDYYVKLLNGNSLNRTQLERGMTNFFASGQLVRQISFTYEVQEVTVTGNEAVVLVEQKDKRIQIRKDGQPHRVEANVLHRDTWVQTAEGWKRRLTEEVKQTKFTVDGKPV